MRLQSNCIQNVLQHIKRLLFAVIFSVFLPAFTNAQQFETAISPSFKNFVTTPVKYGSDFLVMFDGGVGMQLSSFTFKLDKVKFGIVLFRYDSTMKMVKKNMLADGQEKFGPFPSQLKQIGSKYYLVYSIYNPSDGLQWWLAGIDPETLNLGTAQQLISMDVSNLRLGRSEVFFDASGLQISESPNGSKLLVSWSNTKSKKFYLAVLDSSLKLEWKKDFESSVTGDVEEFTSCIDDKGVAYVSYMSRIDKNEWIYKVAAYGAERRLKESEVKTKNSKVYQVILIPSKAGNLVHVAGSYSENPGKLSGLFHQTISTDNYALKDNGQYPFTRALVEQLDADNWASVKEKSYGLNDLRMQGFELSDGSVALVGQWWKTLRTERTSASVSGSILTARIRNGNVSVASIPRYRVSTGNPMGSSHKAIPFGNKLLIFYNDYESNLKRDPLKPPIASNNYRHSSLVAAQLNDDGTIKREPVIGILDDGFVPTSEYIQPIESNKLLIPIFEIKGMGGIGNESKWGVITVK